jgi:non-ribosomal peptide synthetase component E (peptide arylation enzyme)
MPATRQLPERLELLDWLPLTSVGTVAKKDLRDDNARELAMTPGVE